MNVLKTLTATTIISTLGVSAQAVTVLDDFSGDLSNYTATVMADVNGGASNVFAFGISGGALQITTTTYDGIEQIAFILNGASLAVGEELQVDVDFNDGLNDLGLYVGGKAPVTGVREDFVIVQARTGTADVVTTAFNSSGTNLGTIGAGASDPGFDTLFILRDGTNDFQLGYYASGVKTVLADRDNLTNNDGSVLGFYADVREAGTIGALDNLRIVPEPNSLALLGLGGLAMIRRRRA